MKTIGSIGLGAMGGSYAKFLIENNYRVYGVDPDSQNADIFISLGGKLLNNEGGIKRFDSLAVEKNGNICVGTLFNGGISVISPSGDLVEFIKFEDPYITNICFGSKDLKTAYITASYEGQLLEVKWDREGLPLNFLNK